MNHTSNYHPEYDNNKSEKSCDRKDITPNHINEEEPNWKNIDTKLKMYHKIFIRVLIGIVVLSCLLGVSFAIIISMRFYKGDKLFFSHKKPLFTQIEEDSLGVKKNVADIRDPHLPSEKHIPSNDQIQVKKIYDASQILNENGNIILNQEKQSSTDNSAKQEYIDNTIIKSFSAEIASVKDLLLNLNKSYQDLANRLDKTEVLLANPLQNPNVQRMISLIILKNTIDKAEYPLDKKIVEKLPILNPCTAVLMNFVNKKIPTILEIISQFPKVSEEMIAENESIEENSGFMDYWYFQIKKLIKIRFVGDVEGDTLTALMSRIKNNLMNGELIKAAAEWDKMPEKAKKPGISLRNALEAHVCSDQIIKEELLKISQKDP
ncbi:MAG: hypothetical protein C4617_05795 [Candidatus Liberibacter europaeus]|uniref:Uncharacterized protein n=1 Tax=Candidatus Liberibacter europaeus TaxID=744859 RepID=A0A2T4VWB9_9HYPH|nr:hypothetical protein [Candidatus Liberibacter europaeus]PTL86063.1 MAG: hypothetical protein C4617_05795 [Candidatus Liberibacter europaeus]